MSLDSSGVCRCWGRVRAARRRCGSLISPVRFDARRGAFECSSNMDETGLSRDGAQQALRAVGATLGPRFARRRHGWFAFGPYDDASLAPRLSAT
mgnify:CR=1 FL=1